MIKVIVIAIFILPAMLLIAADKNEIYEKIKSEYSGVNSIKISASAGEGEGEFNLTAKKGNKYILNTAGRIIISDGKTIWNYSPTDKTVIISSLEEDLIGFSPESFFFDLITKLKPQKLSDYRSSDFTDGQLLTLIPAQSFDNTPYAGIRKIKMLLKGYNIRRIIIDKDGAELMWNIKSIKLNTNIKDDKFSFDPPDDAELIDLR
ncbi:MAG: LolA family protein [Candidatus Kapaibacterium sp.]